MAKLASAWLTPPCTLVASRLLSCTYLLHLFSLFARSPTNITLFQHLHSTRRVCQIRDTLSASWRDIYTIITLETGLDTSRSLLYILRADPVSETMGGCSYRTNGGRYLRGGTGRKKTRHKLSYGWPGQVWRNCSMGEWETSRSSWLPKHMLCRRWRIGSGSDSA